MSPNDPNAPLPLPSASDEDASFLILAPYRGHWQIVTYPTSRVLRANCGHLAWLSPQGEPYVDTCYLICLDCADEVVTDPDPHAPRVAVAGAMEAVQGVVGEEGMSDVRAFMKRFGIKEQ